MPDLSGCFANEYRLKIPERFKIMRALLIVVYVLHLFWTGLWASIAAQVLKLNAFWFCLLLGTVCLIGGLCIAWKKIGLRVSW